MSTSTRQYRDPVRSVDPILLADLEVVSTRIYDLPGGKGRRWVNEHDPRLSHLEGTPKGDEVVYYEHIASLRAPRGKMYFVAFRETVDALLLRSQDMDKYPEWLMKDPRKQQERMIYIYMVTRHPKDVPVIRSHEDWLAPVPNDRMFDALAYFLYKNDVISYEQYTGV